MSFSNTLIYNIFTVSCYKLLWERYGQYLILGPDNRHVCYIADIDMLAYIIVTNNFGKFDSLINMLQHSSEKSIVNILDCKLFGIQYAHMNNDKMLSFVVDIRYMYLMEFNNLLKLGDLLQYYLTKCNEILQKNEFDVYDECKSHCAHITIFNRIINEKSRSVSIFRIYKNLITKIIIDGDILPPFTDDENTNKKHLIISILNAIETIKLYYKFKRLNELYGVDVSEYIQKIKSIPIFDNKQITLKQFDMKCKLKFLYRSIQNLTNIKHSRECVENYIDIITRSLPICNLSEVSFE